MSKKINSERKHVKIYTDGACSGNPGKGGYGAIITYENREIEISQGFVLTTNNRMELTAVIIALKKLKFPCDVSVYSDSKYVVSAIEEKWLVNWQARGWCKADRKPVLNKDLWVQLADLLEIHNVKFNWVKGHSSNLLNERCDILAVKSYNLDNLIIDKGMNIVNT